MADEPKSTFDANAIRKAKLVTRLVRALNADCDVTVSVKGLFKADDLMAIGADKPGADPDANCLLLKGAAGYDTEIAVYDWFKKNVLPFQKEMQPEVDEFYLDCNMKRIEPSRHELMALPAQSELSATAYDAERTGIKSALAGKAVVNIGPLLRNLETFEHVVDSLEKVQGRRRAMKRAGYTVAALASAGLVVDGEMRRQKQPADELAPLVEEGVGLALGAGTAIKALSGGKLSQMSQNEISTLGYNLLDQFAGKEPSHNVEDRKRNR